MPWVGVAISAARRWHTRASAYAARAAGPPARIAPRSIALSGHRSETFSASVARFAVAYRTPANAVKSGGLSATTTSSGPLAAHVERAAPAAGTPCD